MGRRLKRALIGFASLLAVVASCAAGVQWLLTRRELTATPPPGRLVDVGGHRLHIRCMGAGHPSVILENGLGGTSVEWGFVQPEVARFTQVCSYDRAGIGYSDPGPSPRTARRLAGELARLLEGGVVRPPVVLVGASIGGFVLRVLASEQPALVAGLVLVDASHEDQTHEIPAIAPFVRFLAPFGVFRLLRISFGQPADAMAPAVRELARATQFRSTGYQAAADELMHVRESAAEVRSTRRELAIPLVVLTGARGADATWRELQRDQAGLSKRGCQTIAQQAGHVVHLEQPQVVVEAIRAVVETAAGRSVSLCGPG